MEFAHLGIRLEADVKKQLKHLGVDFNLTLSEVVRRIVLDFLSKDEAEQYTVLELTQVGEER